jgi:hypothetical protein
LKSILEKELRVNIKIAQKIKKALRFGNAFCHNENGLIGPLLEGVARL